jgi:hypothetical protein
MNLEKTSPDAPVIGGDPSMGVVVLKEFISPIEQSELRKTAELYRKTGVLEPIQAGPFRFSRSINGTEYCNALITSIGERVIKSFGLGAFQIDPYLGWLVSYIEPGGFIHPHFDRQPLYMETDKQHLRCNVMVSNGGSPADPVIDGRPFRVEERSLWAFFPSHLEHRTHPNGGPGPRIVYQFGFAAPGHYRMPTFKAKLVME